MTVTPISAGRETISDKEKQRRLKCKERSKKQLAMAGSENIVKATRKSLVTRRKIKITLPNGWRHSP